MSENGISKAFWMAMLAILLSACGENRPLTPEEAARQFWTAAQARQMDRAKQMVYWETAGYLDYIASDKISIKQFVFGKAEKTDKKAIIETEIILVRKNGSDVKVPTETVVILTEGVWRVQLQETMAGVLRESMNKMANQLNGLFRQSLKELDKAIAQSVDEISGSLEQGAKELSNVLQENSEQLGKSLQQLQQQLDTSPDKQ